GVADFVVGFGQSEHGLDDRIVFVMARAGLVGGAFDRRLKLAQGELGIEYGENLLSKYTVNTQLDELAEKQGLVVQRIGNELRRRDEPSRFVHADVALGVDRPAAKGDRRDVSLAGGAQAQEKTPASWRESGLVGMPDHRGIEQGGRLEGVFLGEIRADQHA